MYAIEKNIPVPADSAAGRKKVYPFSDMNVGDSFGIPVTKETAGQTRARVSSSAAIWGKKTGTKFIVRTLPGLLRVWRTA